ncbi:MAG: GNAT family N-acetyltransferase [Proteobacteria bacterium]|nr:GNAT family N-acetyltransferase [Pseudomonadota bacterium]
MSPQPDIRRGRAQDLPAVLALLEAARLPTADIVSINEPQIWVLEKRGAIVGAVALECFGREALLRSLVIAPEYRKRGLGRELVACVENAARTDHISQLVLLTETAEHFFRSLGYGVLDRQQVSAGLQQSAEFRSLCPVSAICLSKTIAAALS